MRQRRQRGEKVVLPTARAATEKITVYLLDDHEIVRLGLKTCSRARATSRSSVSPGRPPTRQRGIAGPATRGGGAGRQAAGRLRHRRLPGDRVPRRDIAALITDLLDDDEALFGAIMAGAAGYVLKQIRGTDLIGAVRRVAAVMRY